MAFPHKIDCENIMGLRKISKQVIGIVEQQNEKFTTTHKKWHQGLHDSTIVFAHEQQDLNLLLQKRDYKGVYTFKVIFQVIRSPRSGLKTINSLKKV